MADAFRFGAPQMGKSRAIVATLSIPAIHGRWDMDLDDLRGLASLCSGDGFGRDLDEAITEIEALSGRSEGSDG